jgi:hypothetical protein
VNYTRSQFFSLMQAVEDQGGDHLDRTCESPPYFFKQFEASPVEDDAWKFSFTGSTKKVTFPSCGHSALFAVPFLDDPEEKVTVCAVEDSMGLWPRFADQVAEG